jgi:hypothetical protein
LEVGCGGGARKDRKELLLIICTRPQSRILIMMTKGKVALFSALLAHWGELKLFVCSSFSTLTRLQSVKIVLPFTFIFYELYFHIQYG